MTEPMVDDALVEKVARALHDLDEQDHGLPTWDEQPAAHDYRRDQARAAIAIAYPAGVAAGREEAAEWHDKQARLIREDADKARSVGMEVSDSCGCLDHYADLHEGHATAIRQRGE